MIYVVNINNKEYEVEVEKGKANLIKTTEVAPKVSEAIPIPAAAPVSAPVSAPEQEAVDGTSVEAPMPGTILDIKVNTGDKVNKGQLLVILEAMKMENEIYAPAEGTVVQVLVSKGSSVDTNETMMVLK